MLKSTHMPSRLFAALVPEAAYRRDIDGLRAIAVLAVILYHFKVPGFGGGFIGVDIFFVISGFLIGMILWRELAATGKISLVEFYRRRILRLAPAYFAMTAATLAAAWFLLLPTEFRAFGKSLVAATVYLSNVQFFRTTDYFNPTTEDDPLLHTWSLAVEEQFYLLLPATMLAFRRVRMFLPTALGVLFAGSLIACVVLTPWNNIATFYLFPFRAWELLAGVLLGIGRIARGRPFAVHAAFSWIGMTLVLGSIFLLRAGADFPGWKAIPAVAGTTLLILSGERGSAVVKALSSPIAVAIGLMSYSLYIWHWPIAVLSQYVRGDYAGPLETSAWLALVFVISFLSYRFIETPIRLMKGLSNLKLFGAAGVASAAMVICGFAVFRADGAPGRYADDVRIHVSASQDFSQDWSRCTKPAKGPFRGLEVCPIGVESAAPTLFVWGDSHGRALKEGIDLAAREAGVAGFIVWQGGCPPLFNVDKDESVSPAAVDAQCAAQNDLVRSAIAASPSIKRVLLIGRWAYYAEGEGVGRDAKNAVRVVYRGAGANGDWLKSALDETAREFRAAGRDVFVLRQIPEIPEYDSREFAKDAAFGRIKSAADADRLTAIRLSDAQARRRTADVVFDAAQAEGLIRVLDPDPYFCSAGECRFYADGMSLYFDNNHVTNRSAQRMRRLFEPAIGGAPSASTP
jgi:peptidoglycan/LPS O-acetylase OafA/YrhL